MVDVSGYFTGSGLSYAATSDTTGVATVSVSGTTVTVRGVAAGSAIITVTARNTAGSAEQTFTVTVSVPPPGVTGSSIPALAVNVGASAVVDVSGYFTGSGLSYAATSDTIGVATVSVSGTTVTVRGVAAGSATITVTARNTGGRAEQTFTVTVSAVPTGPTGPGGNGGGGGGGGGGEDPPPDTHGNTPETATVVTLSPAAPSPPQPGHLVSATDVDYFRLDITYAGLLFVETTGPTDTVGRIARVSASRLPLALGPPSRAAPIPAGRAAAFAPAGAEEDDDSGVGGNFRLGLPVTPGVYTVAVTGSRGATGPYALEARLVAGYLENPGAGSFQSGIGVLSGWVCEAEEVVIEIVTERGAVEWHAASYGTARLDTREVCGDTDNGFGVLFNWNRLGEGAHTVIAWVDGEELGRAAVTVTTLGAEFLRGVEGECVVEDFPQSGETVTLEWQQNSQNFVIAGEAAPRTAPSVRTAALVGYLENPGTDSFQSGIGVLSGWVCEAEEVELEITRADGAVVLEPASYGTARPDTAGVCGDTDNGFGVLFNWNRLGDGEHTVVAYVDGEELGRATVRVTTLGAEFLRGVAGECVVEDFPQSGETVTLEWQQNSQNFVITQVK